MDGWVGGWVDALDGLTDRRTDIGRNRRIDRQTVRQMGGWMDLCTIIG